MTDNQSAALDRAVDLLRKGELVGIPTETVYGLAADASNPTAVARIFAAKGRPADHPLIVHINGKEQLEDWAQNIPDHAWLLAEKYWPGPLTLILPRHPHVPDAVTGGQDTVGLRAPDHPLTQELLRRFSGGLAAPSANRFGHVSPTTAQHVIDELGSAVPLVLDGGACPIGVESTIVGLVGPAPVLLRPGDIAREEIEELLGCSLVHHQHVKTAHIRVSGLLDSHYAPHTPLTTGALPELVAATEEYVARGEPVVMAVLGSTPIAIPGVAVESLPTTPAAFAQQLYATLRRLDQQGYAALFMEQPPQTPDWLAVNDRLFRAARRRLVTSSQ